MSCGVKQYILLYRSVIKTQAQGKKKKPPDVDRKLPSSNQLHSFLLKAQQAKPTHSSFQLAFQFFPNMEMCQKISRHMKKYNMKDRPKNKNKNNGFWIKQK